MTNEELAEVLYHALREHNMGAYVGKFDPDNTTLDGDFDLEKVAEAALLAIAAKGEK